MDNKLVKENIEQTADIPDFQETFWADRSTINHILLV